MPGLPHRDQSEGQGIPRDRKARRTNNNEGGVKERPGLLCKPVTALPSLATEFRTAWIWTNGRSAFFCTVSCFGLVIQAFSYEFFYRLSSLMRRDDEDRKMS